MNYAVYFGLTFAGCFMSMMISVLIICWLVDLFFFEGDESEWKNK